LHVPIAIGKKVTGSTPVTSTEKVIPNPFGITSTEKEKVILKISGELLRNYRLTFPVSLLVFQTTFHWGKPLQVQFI